MTARSTARLRAELVQVAAVAVAIVEDLDTDSASLEGLAEALADTAEERHRQNQLWGPQHHPPGIWLAILAEEVGEVAREVGKIVLTANGSIDELEERLVNRLITAEREARAILAQMEGES